MNTEELELLIGQCEDFHSAFIMGIQSNEASLGSLSEFLLEFFTGVRSYTLVTKADLDKLMTQIVGNDTIQSFVFSLRNAALTPFSKESLGRIIDGFANANSNAPADPETNRLCALPSDAENWRVKKSDLVNLYNANLWLIPLLAFSFLFKEKMDTGSFA